MARLKYGLIARLQSSPDRSGTIGKSELYADLWYNFKVEVRMYIENLELKNFRNYENLNIEPVKGVNILTGDNAQGKTNILEAVFFCAYGRSHRTSRDREMQMFDAPFTTVSVDVAREQNDKKIVLRFNGEGRKFIEINGRKITRIPDLLGNLYVIMFSPEDLKIVKETPGIRRRFLDMEISALDKIYYHDLVSYNKVIQERNNLLKMRSVDRTVLDVYDAKAAQYGARIIRQRMDYMKKLNDRARSIHLEITGGKEEIEYAYRCGIPLTENLEESLVQALAENRRHDLERGTTSVGPHRDDFAILINGADARIFGSQGQQRTVILTLKFASLGIIRDLTGEYPVLLLDDVLSELDLSRQNFILSSIDGIQTIISMTGYENIEKRLIEGARVFHIRQGTATMEVI